MRVHAVLWGGEGQVWILFEFKARTCGGCRRSLGRLLLGKHLGI